MPRVDFGIFRMQLRSPLGKGHIPSREEITKSYFSLHCVILPITSFLWFSINLPTSFTTDPLARSPLNYVP